MKRMLYFVMALALVLGFTQCKKDQMEQQGERVHITLDVDGGNSNSRVVVDPTNGGANNYASVTFENGDVIYVAYNNAYVGTLTYSGSAFSGDIDITQSGDQPLHFYCLGGKGFTVNRDGNTVTVVISDQSTKYPVISYAPSNEYYSSGSTSYTAKLLNKCSIMKFDVTTPSTAAVCITGMNNKVTVDFSKVAETGTGLTGSTTDNGFSYEVNSTDGGLIKMPAKDASNITWAIVLPQEALAEGAEGSAYTNGYIGNRPAISKIERNHYYAGDGIAMTINTASNIIDLATVTENLTVGDGWTLTGTLGVNKKISIADGATVTLNNVIINGTNEDAYKWAGITCLGDATIILSGTNTVKGFFENYPGIQAAVGKTLTINGTGSLTASSNGYGVGIGGGYNIACGNIEIQGGTITATGGNQAAGIGSGFLGTCGNITISGGTVTATGGNNGGAGIGSGYEGTCGNITITRGVTQVTATMGGGATNSIGAGFTGTCGTVTIGGVVTGPITTSPYTYYPGPLTYPIALSAAASDYVGSVVTTDGNVYATVADASAASKTAVAIIAYVGTAGSVDASSASYKGLAIALSDANSGSKCQWAKKDDGYAHCLNGIGETNAIATALGFMNGITCTSTLTAAGHSSHNHTAATAAVSNNGTTAPTGTSGWFMPSMGQWNLIVQGLATKKAGSAVTTDLTTSVNNTYKANNLNSVITDAGGTGFQAGSYWASTEETHVRAWVIYFTDGCAFNYAKDATWYVRSVIAF